MIAEIVEFARTEFQLSLQEKDGYSRRQHLLAAWEASGIEPEELASAPPLPAAGLPFWTFYTRLHSSRQSNGFAAMRMTAHDVKAWSDLLRVRLEPWEIQAFVQVEDAYFEVMAEHKPKG